MFIFENEIEKRREEADIDGAADDEGVREPFDMLFKRSGHENVFP